MKSLPRGLLQRLWEKRWRERDLSNERDIATVESRLIVGAGGTSYVIRRRGATVGLVASTGTEFAPGERVQLDTFAKGTAMSISGAATPELSTTRGPESMDVDVTNFQSLL